MEQETLSSNQQTQVLTTAKPGSALFQHSKCLPGKFISFHDHLEGYFSHVFPGRVKVFGSLGPFLGPQKVKELYTTQIYKSKYLKKSRDWEIKIGAQ